MITPAAISKGSTSRSPVGTMLNSKRSAVSKRRLIGAVNTRYDSHVPSRSVTRLGSNSKKNVRAHEIFGL